MDNSQSELTFLKKLLAFILIFIGILGIFLPFVQGLFLIVLGVSIIGFDTIRKEILSVKEKIDKYDSENKSSYMLKLYSIPLNWILFLEQKKIKKTLDDISNKKDE